MFSKLYIFFIYICIVNTSVFSAEKTHIIPSLKVSVPLISSLNEEAAIEMGTGENTMYVFVDPFCHFSRDFITKISKNKRLLKIYNYKIYLLKLKKFNSLETMRYIYSRKNKLKALISIMVNKKKIPSDLSIHSKKIDKLIEDIKKVGNKLDIYKRPYLIIAKKNWEKELEEEEDW